MKKIFSRISDLFRQPGSIQPSAIGMAWYREDQWPRLLEISADRDRLEKTYEAWRMVAQRKFDELVKNNVNVVKVPIEIEDLNTWCREMGRVVDSEGRIAYVKNRVAQVKLGNIDRL